MVIIWIFTNRGFYSVVESSKDPSKVVVRARVREDLEALKEFIPGIEIVELPNRDYGYRAFVKRHVWERTMTRLTKDIDYTNFKDSVKDKQGGARASKYMSVWSIMLSLQPFKSFGKYGNWDRWPEDDLRTEGQPNRRKKKKGKKRKGNGGRLFYDDGYQAREIIGLDDAIEKAASDECPRCQWPVNDGCMCRWFDKEEVESE